MFDRVVPLFKLGFVLCAAAVFGLAVMPGHFDPVHVWDKAKHFFAFFVLGSLAALAFPRQRPVALGLLLSGFGALIEIVQGLPFVHRDASFNDWVADSLAVLVVMFASVLIRNTIGSFRTRPEQETA